MKINRKYKKIILPILLLVIMGGIFLSGFYLGNSNRPLRNRQTLAYSEEARQAFLNGDRESFDFNLYFEVWNSIKSNHFSKNQIKERDLFYGSLEGLAGATDDPYTVFMNPELTTEFYQDLAGTFEGIGAEVGKRDDMITIVAPLEGMPAQKAGLRAGDKVYAINSESALGLTVTEAVKKIRGPKGTTVTLTIIRGEAKPFDVEIVRDKIVIASVETEMRSDGYYIIRITNFNDDTEALFNQAINDILTKSPKGIILDLRNNPGGYLETAVFVASEWIKDGLVVAEQFGENRRNEHFSNQRARLKDFATVVLINEGSASASEIVAGALRDYKEATIIGMKSFGKGSVQAVKDLSDGSSLKLTVAHWLTPAGDQINEKGIEPDITVDFTEEDIKNEKDPQFDRALEFLKTGK